MLSLAKFIKKYSFLLIMSREIELRENLVGTGFINPPDERSDFNNRVTVVGKLWTSNSSRRDSIHSWL